MEMTLSNRGTSAVPDSPCLSAASSVTDFYRWISSAVIPERNLSAGAFLARLVLSHIMVQSWKYWPSRGEVFRLHATEHGSVSPGKLQIGVPEPRCRKGTATTRDRRLG